MEKSTLEEIKMKNPFMYIIKLSESKKRNKSKSNIKNKKGFITPIPEMNQGQKSLLTQKNPNFPKKKTTLMKLTH